jgi:acyl phosphate:glycerol-3-phosphate acyltransferase
MKILFVVGSYLLGSVPTGYLLVRLFFKSDVRDLGSGNTGATNVLRVKGWKTALPVALFDVLKGFLPVFLAMKAFDDPAFAAASGFAAVVGHCFPFAIGFRGGKGMATSFGAFAAVAWAPALACLGLFVVIVALTRYVSLGSILAVLAFPVIDLIGRGPAAAAAVSCAIAVLVVVQHRANIGRLVRGTERKFGERAI